MKLNRKWMLVVALVLSVALATGGTMAYLTDTDKEINVFTLGQVDIDLEEPNWTPDSPLLPNEPVNKDPYIKNKGATDAWVWMEVAIPTPLYPYIELDYNLSADGWSKDPDVDTTKKPGYTIVTLRWQDTLEAATDEQTQNAFNTVVLNEFVDIKEDGELYIVQNGTETAIGWNITDDPDIEVTGYAIQATDSISDVNEAYNYYNAQWNGTSGGGSSSGSNTAVDVSDAAELVEALAAGSDVKLTQNVVVTDEIDITGQVIINLNGNELDASSLNNDRPFHMAEGASLTINGENGTVKIGALGLVNVPNDVKNATIKLNGGTYEGTTSNGAMIRLRAGNENVDITLNDVVYTDDSNVGYIISTEGFSGVGNLVVVGGSYTANYGFQIYKLDATFDNVTINTKGTAVEASWMSDVTVKDCDITINPGVTVVHAPAAGIVASNDGIIQVTDTKIAGNMQAVYYIYNSGGVINAAGNDIGGANCNSIWKNDSPSAGSITIDGTQVSP